MSSSRRLRGTKDIIGPEGSQWESIERVARRIFQRFSYQPLRTPIIEETALYMHSVGEATDIVEKEMYRFEDRSKVDIALRPEGTAGVVRAYIENHLGRERSVNRFYYYGPMFRAERPQAGRLRQFHQIGAETFGSRSSLADAENIEVLVRVVEELGIKDYQIQLNNLGDAADRAKFSKIIKGHFEKQKNTLCNQCQRRLDRNVFRVLDCKERDCQGMIDAAPRISDYVSEESRKRFDDVLSTLDVLGIAYQHNSRIVRGLDYYTHTVFEMTHPSLGSQDALAAGGRYDALVGQMGGPDTPAVGFALGMERLLMVMQASEGATPMRAANHIRLIALGSDPVRKGFQIVSELRRNGIVASMDFESRSLKSQMRTANKMCVDYVAILGEDEMKENILTVKNMKEEGSQETMRQDALVEFMKKKVAHCHV